MTMPVRSPVIPLFAVARLPLIAVMLAAGHLYAAPMSLTAKLEKDHVAVTAGGELFTSYRCAPSLKKPYFWPVIGPRSGKSVTVESVPNQYPHHNSIWIGCDRVNNQNFWQPHGKIENGQIKSAGPKLVQGRGEAVVFTDECIWQKPGASPVIRDARRITISAPSADLRLIDFDITLHMLADVTVRKTNHSLFAVRVTPDLSVKSGGTLVNAEGHKGEKQTFGVASAWCDYYGTRDGITEGVALFQHACNRWYPCKWFTRDYGFMSPTPMYWPPNGKDQRFSKGEEIRLRYRVVVHAGDAKAANIAGLFEQYADGARIEQATRILDQLKACRFGQSRQPLIAMAGLIRETKASSRREIERRLIVVLQTDATFDCKQFICQKLSEIATELSVPVLARLLTDEKLSNTARFALERIPSPRAGEVLREALGRFTGELKIGVVNSIGNRRDRKAVPELAKLAQSQDAALSAAAVSALGRIGMPEAAEALARVTVPHGLGKLKADALLLCADRMCDAGEIDGASAVYRRMVAEPNAMEIRIAALEGVVRTDKERSLPTVLAFLKAKEPALQEAAAKFAAKMPPRAATETLAAQLPSLSPNARVALLSALAARGDKAATPAVARAANSADEGVRVAGIRALGVLGDASHVEALAGSAAAGGRAGKAAAESLLLLSGDGVDAAMASAMGGAKPNVRVVLIRSLVAREYDAVIPVLLHAAKERDRNVHKAACKALGLVAGLKELPAMVALLVAAKDSSARRNLEQAISAAVARVKDDDACAQPVIAGLAGAGDEAKASLLAILNRVGGAKALAAVRGQLASDGAAVRKAAVQALAEWPDPAPMADLLRIAKEDPNVVHQVLAFRGYLRQAIMPADRSATETTKLLGEAMRLAKRPQERKAILAVLPRFACNDALALAESCLGDKAIAAEAELAVRELRRWEGPKFDFQLKGSPVMAGFAEVNRSTLYNERRGYGWLKAPSAERDRKKGTNLTRDFVFDTAGRTFRVKVANGPRVVTVYLGDMGPGHDNMEVLAEGELKLEKVTVKPGEVKELSFHVDVEDGVLDIEFRDAGGKNPHWTCAGVAVGK